MASDTMPSSTPPTRRLERKVRVTLPIARVSIFPRRAAARVGDRLAFTVQVLDRSGAHVPDAPAEVRVIGGGHGRAYLGPVVQMQFDTAGLWSFIATFRDRADTLRVTVTERRR
jgi:hypothetical protein